MTDLVEARPGEAKPKASLVAHAVDLLTEEGYRPQLRESEGRFRSIDFKVEGLKFILRLDEQDPDFLILCLGYLFDELVRDVLAVLRAGHDVQADAKVVKFFLDPEYKFFEMQAELFLGGHPLNMRHLTRCISALRRAVADFHERTHAEAPVAQA